MKKKSNKDNSKTSTRNLVYAYLSLAALVVVATVLGYWLYSYRQGSATSIDPAEVHQPVDPSLVCMVNDAYMGKLQIPVPVNGKTYYGCCQGCVDKLNNLESARIAIDPFSGNPVDKSEAYIVLMNPQGAVAYFESEANYNAFKKN
jgi:YHS domain-containing protein